MSDIIKHMDITEIFDNFELTGNSLIIEDLENAPEKEITQGGIILTKKIAEDIVLKKGRVLKVGLGYWENGVWIKTPIEKGAIIYYKNAGKYEVNGIKFLGTEIGQVVAYKNA